MKSNLNIWKIAAAAIALTIVAFGCADSGNQQPANESAKDTTAILPSTGTAAIPSDSETMASVETGDSQAAVEKPSQAPAAENGKPVKSATRDIDKNIARPKADNKNTKRGTTTPAATSSQENPPKTTVKEPTPPAPPPKAPEPKPEPKVTPAAPPVEKPAPKDPAPPVPPAPKAVEKPAPPAKPEVPKPAPQTAAEPDTDWPVPEKYRNMVNPIAADKESLSDGKSMYRKHCASCHGKSGLGDGSKAASLDTPSGDMTEDAFQAQTDGALYFKIVKGRDDMPSFKKKIPYPEDIWSIVNYIRTFK